MVGKNSFLRWEGRCLRTSWQVLRLEEPMAGLGLGSQGKKTSAKKGDAQSKAQAGVATCKRADYL